MNDERLFDNYLRKELTADETKEFKHRLGEEPAFAREFLAYVHETGLMVQVASRMERVAPEAGSTATPRAEQTSWVGAGRWRRDGRRSSRVLWPAAAACLLAAAGGALIFGLRNGPEDRLLAGELRATRQGQTISMKAGERIETGDRIEAASVATCLLRDGSVVKLDRGSRVVLRPRARGERGHLALEEGRMFLRAAKARGKLVISGEKEEVEILGTVFGVAKMEAGLSVSVFRGQVVVRSTAGEIEIGNGQSAQAAGSAKPTLTDTDPNQALLWARETTEFRHRPLGEVADWIEANSSLTFDIPQPLRAEIVSITISEDPMRTVVRSVCLACGLKCDIAGTVVTIRR